jgi:hypothetical protein
MNTSDVGSVTGRASGTLFPRHVDYPLKPLTFL